MCQGPPNGKGCYKMHDWQSLPHLEDKKSTQTVLLDKSVGSIPCPWSQYGGPLWVILLRASRQVPFLIEYFATPECSARPVLPFSLVRGVVHLVRLPPSVANRIFNLSRNHYYEGGDGRSLLESGAPAGSRKLDIRQCNQPSVQIKYKTV